MPKRAFSSQPFSVFRNFKLGTFLARITQPSQDSNNCMQVCFRLFSTIFSKGSKNQMVLELFRQTLQHFLMASMGQKEPFIKDFFLSSTPHKTKQGAVEGRHNSSAYHQLCFFRKRTGLKGIDVFQIFQSLEFQLRQWLLYLQACYNLFYYEMCRFFNSATFNIRRFLNFCRISSSRQQGWSLIFRLLNKFEPQILRSLPLHRAVAFKGLDLFRFCVIIKQPEGCGFETRRFPNKKSSLFCRSLYLIVFDRRNQIKS